MMYVHYHIHDELEFLVLGEFTEQVDSDNSEHVSL